MAEVTGFIARFRKLSKTDEIITVFTCGCCYWFAHILCARFGGSMMYDPVANHFAAGIGGRVYDITGDVTDQYVCIPWSSFNDPIEKQRIEDCCIRFTK